MRLIRNTKIRLSLLLDLYSEKGLTDTLYTVVGIAIRKAKHSLKSKYSRRIYNNRYRLGDRKTVIRTKLENQIPQQPNKLRIAFAVSEKGQDSTAGDFFTASELAIALKNKCGAKCIFLSNAQNEWYDIPLNVDILVCMLERYDIEKLYKSGKRPLTIAWARNWFDKWISDPNTGLYDIILCSSKATTQEFETRLGRKVHFYPIATNTDRFNPSNLPVKAYISDYTFTGNYWHNHREITSLLNPTDYPEWKFKVFGKNWEKNKILKQHTAGHINYSEIPKVYASTKIVIDDANQATKKFGSLNSRVFDAIASGKLVITNNKIGSNELFPGLLPFYTDKTDLNNLLKLYLENTEKRELLQKKLTDIVRKKHSYRERADSLIKIVKQNTKHDLHLAIKTATPSEHQKESWGDYHFAMSLGTAFEKIGVKCSIHTKEHWNNHPGVTADATLLLRGLEKYKPLSCQLNYMWIISHPELVINNEFRDYNFTFIASENWPQNTNEPRPKNSATLFQCTDPYSFFPENFKTTNGKTLFIGNTRNEYRNSVKWTIDSGHEISVVGSGWEKFIDKKSIHGTWIKNNELRKHYCHAKILLNDHWDEMRENGFISNRVFDATACKANIITDYSPSLKSIFGESVATFNSQEDLKNCLSNPENHFTEEKLQQAYDITREKHTFEHRALTIRTQILKDLAATTEERA